MMKALEIDEGETINFENINLQKADLIRLIPHQHQFNDLTTSSSLALIENAMTLHYPCISANTTILLEGQGKLWEFDVEKIEKEGTPLLHASVIDSDIKIEFGIPLNNNLLENETQMLSIGGEKRIESQVDQGENQFFVIDLKKMDDFEDFKKNLFSLSISLQPLTPSTDLDLYMSCTDPKPTIDSYEHCDNTRGKSEIIISSSMIANSSKIFLGVNNYKSALSKFNLSASKVLNTEKGHQMNDQNNQIWDPEKEKYCNNCRKIIPVASFSLHEIQCKKRNFYCEKCNITVPIDSKEKHNDLYHSFSSCSLCGTKNIERFLLHKHRVESCELRLSKCNFCSLKITEKERFDHLNYCGNRSCLCVHCNQNFKRKEAKHHLVVVHQILPNDINEKDIVNI